MNRLLRELIDGDRGSIRVLLSSCSRGVTAKGAPYLSFTLQDKSGTMDAKYWNVSEELLDLYEPGMIVDAMGDVLSHNHQLQFASSRWISWKRTSASMISCRKDRSLRIR